MAHPSSSPLADVAVIGAGIWGLAAAWRLADAGATVVICDDGGPPTASVAAGMLCPWSEHEDDDDRALYDALRGAAAAWPSFATALEAAAGTASGFHHCGSVYVSARPEHAGAVDRLRSTLARHGRPVPWRDADDLALIEPGLGTAVTGGLALDDEHQTDPVVLVTALRTACAAAGVVTLPGAATVGGARRHGRVVVNAAGHAAGRLSSRVPVRAVKGQILTLEPRDGHPCPIARMVRTPSCYLVPRPDGRVVVGATQEERHDTDVTAAGAFDLLDEALRTCPALGELRLARTAAGLRPATSDLRPAIGADADGLIWATGGFRHGVLLLPVAADAVAAVASGRPLPVIAETFHPGRFG